MSKVGAPKRFDTSLFAKLRAEGLTHAAIAERVGCSQGYVSVSLAKQGHAVGKSGGANLSARANANTVVDFIVANGGSLREALQELNLDVGACTVRSVAKERGIDLVLYRHIGLEKGHWIVNRPYAERGSSGASTPVPVMCKRCSHETEIIFQQLSNRRPPRCPHCGAC